MKKPIIFMFSGQGSQYYNMAKKLYEQNEVFRISMNKLDKIATELIGESILNNMYVENKGYSDRFCEIRYTHPSIFMVEYSLSQALISNNIIPDYLLGTSLGEFCALTISNVLTVEYAMEIVTTQAKILKKYSTQEGGMMAILENANLYLDVPIIHNNSQLIAVNYKKHFVISGEIKMLKEIGEYLKNKNIAFQLLPVNYAFHSSLIEEIKPFFKEIIDTKKLRRSTIPIISGVNGKTIYEIEDDYLWDIIRKPMRFSQAINALEDKGDYVYIDVGPSGTLASFTKNNIPESSDSKIFPIITPFNMELRNLNRLRNEL